MPPKVGAVKRMHQGQAYQYSLFLTVGKTGRLDKGRLCGCAIGQDFQSRSCLHTIFATENDDDFAGKPFRKRAGNRSCRGSESAIRPPAQRCAFRLQVRKNRQELPGEPVGLD